MVCDQASTPRHNRTALNMPEKTKRRRRTKSREEMAVEVRKERKVRGTKSERGIESSGVVGRSKGRWFTSKCICRIPAIFRSAFNGRTCAEFGLRLQPLFSLQTQSCCISHSARISEPVKTRVRELDAAAPGTRACPRAYRRIERTSIKSQQVAYGESFSIFIDSCTMFNMIKLLILD